MEQITSLKKRLARLVSDMFGGRVDENEIYPLFESPAEPKNGELCLPCFRLAKALRTPPGEIALTVARSLSELADEKKIKEISEVKAVSGYVNLYFSDELFRSLIDELGDISRLSKLGEGKTVCLDFSSPNIAKKFHLGHIGTTVIGNALRNIFNLCGYKTVAINHLGDWGTNFGMLICAFKMWSSREKVLSDGVIELEKIYARYNKESRNDKSLEDSARAAFSSLEKGNEEYLELWRLFKEVSLNEYMKVYEILGISFDSFTGESFYTDYMPAVVEELREKGLLKTDDGASVVYLSDYNMPPALILRSDGSTLYPTRDIAAAKWRKQEYDFDKCVYVTSAGQSLHFAQWFKVVELMGYDWAGDLVHVPYGTMSFGGEKLASRTGNIIYLDDLISQAVEKAEKIIEEKNPDLKNKRETAVAVGVGAVVFGGLSAARIKDVDFSWDTALSFEGDTGPYLQYTYARAASVIRKCGGDEVSAVFPYSPSDGEKRLVMQLSVFEDKIRSSLKDYEPSVITRYLLDTCGVFNQFYHSSPIIKAPEDAKGFRITLTKKFLQIAGNCLDLIGMAKTQEI